VKLNARYVSIGDFDDLSFQVSFANDHPAADYDPSAPTEPYLLLQRQFEDDDGGVCYLETHDTDRFAGHRRLRLIEFTPTRLAFEIDRPEGLHRRGNLQALNPTLPRGPAHRSHHLRRGTMRAGASRETDLPVSNGRDRESSWHGGSVPPRDENGSYNKGSPQVSSYPDRARYVCWLP
jgi:hypothetical protein